MLDIRQSDGLLPTDYLNELTEQHLVFLHDGDVLGGGGRFVVLDAPLPLHPQLVKYFLAVGRVRDRVELAELLAVLVDRVELFLVLFARTAKR